MKLPLSDAQLPPKALTRTFSDTVVQMPEYLHRELNSHFPLTFRRSDTIANNLKLQRIAVLLIYRALRDRDCLISYNQELLEEITNSRQRTSLVRFFNNPRRFETVKQFVPDRNCKGRRFVNAALERVQVYRHNGDGVDYGFDWMVLWGFSSSPSLPFTLPGYWLRLFHQSFVDASERLWPGSLLYESLISNSLSAFVIEDVTQREFMELAVQRFENGDLEATPEEAAAVYSRTWQNFQRHPLNDIIRKHGRCYYGLTNQPRDLRRSHLKFLHNGLVSPSEIDMSSTYPVCLAVKCLTLRYCKTKTLDRFIRDVASGDCYAIIAEAAGPKYTRMNHKAQKQAFVIECLFGDSTWFGCTPLFHSFKRLYPDVARLVASIRKQPFGQRSLSNMLNEIEGGFFIDTVLPAMHALGIPALPIHDAIMVPETECGWAYVCMQKLSLDYFGFEPKFKVSPKPLA